MEALISNTFIPYQILAATMEPDEDFVIKFFLREIESNEIEPCESIKFAQCKTEKILAENLQDAILYWGDCNIIKSDLQSENIAVNGEGEVESILFDIEAADLSNVNKFRLVVKTNNEYRIVARGKVYLEL